MVMGADEERGAEDSMASCPFRLQFRCTAKRLHGGAWGQGRASAQAVKCVARRGRGAKVLLADERERVLVKHYYLVSGGMGTAEVEVR